MLFVLFVTFVSFVAVFWQRFKRRRPVHPDLLELLRELDLIPEVESSRRMRYTRTPPDLVHETEERSPEIAPFEPRQRRILAADDPIRERMVGGDLVDEAGDADGILVRHEHA